MTADGRDIDDLLAQAEGLPDGPAKVAVCEEAVALADARRDDEAAFQARLKLTSAACFGGRPDVMMVAYAWILAKYDADPNPSVFRTYEVLWRYKWVLNAAAQFPQFSRAKCDELLADLARRFAGYGAGRHPVLAAERNLAVGFRDFPRARAVAAKMRRARPEYRFFLSLGDCTACVPNAEVTYQTHLKQWDKAVAAAAPILAGELTCHAVPMATYAHLLQPLFELDRLDEAMDFHRRGYRLAAKSAANVGEQAEHVDFLVMTDNLARAAQLAGKHLPGAAAAHAPDERRDAFATYRFLFDVLADRGTKVVRLAMPAGHELHRPDGKVAVADGLAWLDREARALAAAFDARNGSGHFTAAIDGQAKLKRRITPFPYAAKGG